MKHDLVMHEMNKLAIKNFFLLLFSVRVKGAVATNIAGAVKERWRAERTASVIMRSVETWIIRYQQSFERLFYTDL